MLSLHTEHYENFGSVVRAACFKSESTQRISVTSGFRGLYWRSACEFQFASNRSAVTLVSH